MQIEPECFLRHLRACTNAVLPGGRQVLRIGGRMVGWTLPEHAPRGPIADQDGFDAYVRQLSLDGAFRPRHERFDVLDEASGAPLATVDRGAIPILGIAARGVHLNGLVQRADGLHLWIARRAADNRMEPGKLDHITAGGIAASLDAWSTLLKEAEEEASLPATLVQQARPVSTLRYDMQRPEGLRRDRLHCFDLLLPETTTPRPNDGEVADFSLWPLTDVAQRVAHTDDFKFNVNLVLIDLLLRTGQIPPGGIVDAAFSLIRG